jgi:hypothetical protein
MRMSVPADICDRQISAHVPNARFTGSINKQYEPHKHLYEASCYAEPRQTQQRQPEAMWWVCTHR